MKYRVRLVGYFRRYLPEEDAHDLAQEVFIAAYEKLKHANEPATISWLYRTASRRLIDYLRKDVRTRASMAFSTLDRVCDDSILSLTEPGFRRAELSDWLAQTMEIASRVCSDSQTSVMRAYYVYGSFDAAAAALHMEPATVRSHFLRGRATLLAHLVRFRPDLVGGNEAIHAAIEALNADALGGFSTAEYEAIADPEHCPKAFRSACVKIARHLAEPQY